MGQFSHSFRVRGKWEEFDRYILEVRHACEVLYQILRRKVARSFWHELETER
jgi:hypothetical protein